MDKLHDGAVRELAVSLLLFRAKSFLHCPIRAANCFLSKRRGAGGVRAATFCTGEPGPALFEQSVARHAGSAGCDTAC